MYEKIDHGSEMEIREHFMRPTVYLDHWALREFSSNNDIRNKFINFMNIKGGTLRLSIFNIVELSKQADDSQVDSILNLIYSIRDCGLINVDPREVIRKENELISNPLLRFNPSAEMDIVEAHLIANNYPNSWHVSEIIKKILNELPAKQLAKSNINFVKDMQQLLNTGRDNSKHLKKVTKRFNTLKAKGPVYQTATRELFQLALDFVLINKMKMSKYSEWADIFHVIVPVAYCDIVLTDRRWKTFISQTGLSYPSIARIFDKRTLNDFYLAIENWHRED